MLVADGGHGRYWHKVGTTKTLAHHYAQVDPIFVFFCGPDTVGAGVVAKWLVFVPCKWHATQASWRVLCPIQPERRAASVADNQKPPVKDPGLLVPSTQQKSSTPWRPRTPRSRCGIRRSESRGANRTPATSYSAWTSGAACPHLSQYALKKLAVRHSIQPTYSVCRQKTLELHSSNVFCLQIENATTAFNRCILSADNATTALNVFCLQESSRIIRMQQHSDDVFFMQYFCIIWKTTQHSDDVLCLQESGWMLGSSGWRRRLSARIMQTKGVG